MREPLNPNFCFGCKWWNYRCVAPNDEPCSNNIPNEILVKVAHTKKDVDETIEITKKEISENHHSRKA